MNYDRYAAWGCLIGLLGGRLISDIRHSFADAGSGAAGLLVGETVFSILLIVLAGYAIGSVVESEEDE